MLKRSLKAHFAALLLALTMAAPQLWAATPAVKFPPPHWTMFSRDQEIQATKGRRALIHEALDLARAGDVGHHGVGRHIMGT